MTRAFNINRRTVFSLFGSVSALSVIAGISPAFASTTALQDITGGTTPRPHTAIYVARQILTMDPNQPTAEAVAVVDGKIAAVGRRAALEAMVGENPFHVDETFADLVIMAGFVEPHVHPVLASLTMPSAVISIEPWDTTTGYSEQVRDEEGYRSRLAAAMAAHDDPDEVFVTWGYHHYFHGEMSRALLDALAPDVPVIVWHRSCHEVFLNSSVMERLGIDEEFVDTFGSSAASQADLEKGHFYEQGLLDALERLAPALATPERMTEGLRYSIEYYHRSGITTACEPGGFYSRPLQDAVNAAYSDEVTPFNHYFIPDGKTIAGLYRDAPHAMIEATRDTLTWGKGRTTYLPQQVKLFTDGAIFSQLMQMRDGYTDGHEGEWIMDPDLFSYAFQAYWDADYLIQVHNNGDAGMDVLLDNLETAQQRRPRFDHRTMIVHFGFATEDQIARAAALGAIVSANPYYVTALAGRYKTVGIGPERAARMVPLKDAVDAGMKVSFHSDMPMAPAKPLQLVWSAVNRTALEGEVEGADQRLDVASALRAITIDAAHSIRLENEIGSITPGKLANFTVLRDSPFDVPADEIHRIGVWGTVLEGRLQPVDPPSGNAEIANPAAAFCVAQGGRYEIRQGEDGAQGVCVFPDGREQDAWEFMREHFGQTDPAPSRDRPHHRARMRLAVARAAAETGRCTVPGALRDRLAFSVSAAL